MLLIEASEAHINCRLVHQSFESILKKQAVAGDLKAYNANLKSASPYCPKKYAMIQFQQPCSSPLLIKVK